MGGVVLETDEQTPYMITRTIVNMTYKVKISNR
jgi:hypothetical protein